MGLVEGGELGSWVEIGSVTRALDLDAVLEIFDYERHLLSGSPTILYTSSNAKVAPSGSTVGQPVEDLTLACPLGQDLSAFWSPRDLPVGCGLWIAVYEPTPSRANLEPAGICIDLASYPFSIARTQTRTLPGPS